LAFGALVKPRQMKVKHLEKELQQVDTLEHLAKQGLKFFLL